MPAATGGPKVLVIETSGRAGAVALARGRQILETRWLDQARRHARDLAPAVAALLSGAGWSARELDVVLVGRGPGSYTGLRVGIMSAKALAYAAGCALVAVETFAAVARQAPAEALSVHVVADAQQGKAYVQRFARAPAENPPVAAEALAIRHIDDWLARLSAGEWVSGLGVRLVEGRLPPGVRPADPASRDPRPESVLAVGLDRFDEGQRDDPWAVEPLYLRPSSAEEKWAQPPKG